MTGTLFFTFRTLLITMMTIGMMASLTDFRFGRERLLGILAVYSLWVTVSNLALLRLGGELLLLRLFFLTISVPGILLTYWAANDSPAQAVFNYSTQIMVSALLASMLRWFTEALGLPWLVNLLLMCLCYGAAIWLEWRLLRRPFRMLVQVMPTRWGVLTLIPCVFCGYLILLAAWPASYLDCLPQRIYLYAAIIPLLIVYIAVFKSLVAQSKAQTERQNAALLAVQVAALKEKMLKVKEVEDGIRIQRHDLRHQLLAVTELVARGDRAAALDVLDTARQRLDEQKPVRWCAQPVLDAVFSSYFSQAKEHGIALDADIALSDTLPVDECELAIVFANALENAVQANLKLPPDRRRLRCRAASRPSLMLEIANPCAGTVPFDEQGLPIARRTGHGWGVQSISAFCKKYGAVCQFTQQEGWFRLRLIL